MAEEAQQDRTEQATPKRRQDARDKGDVPRSRELTMTGVMLAGAGSLLLMGGPMGSDLLQLSPTDLRLNANCCSMNDI